MGNIANIAVENDDGSRVYLYSHWDGERIIQSLVEGLNSGRVGDPAYLARIIFQHMIRDEPLGSETGYGISTSIQDNEHPIPVVLSDGDVAFEDSEYGLIRVPKNVFLTALEGSHVGDKNWIDLADNDELYDILLPKLEELTA